MSDSLFGNSEVFMGDFVDAEDIFGDGESQDVDNAPEEETKDPENNETNLPEGEVDAADIFGDESPESVGDDKDNDKEKEETAPKGAGSSPKGTNLYSSFGALP